MRKIKMLFHIVLMVLVLYVGIVATDYVRTIHLRMDPLFAKPVNAQGTQYDGPWYQVRVEREGADETTLGEIMKTEFYWANQQIKEAQFVQENLEDPT